MTDMKKKTRETIYCSFCGKSQEDVRKLIAGPVAWICDECILLCVPLVTGQKIGSREDRASALNAASRLACEGSYADYKGRYEATMAMAERFANWLSSDSSPSSTEELTPESDK